MFFNAVINLGDELDPTTLLVLNVLVIIHLIAFVLLMIVVCRNLAKSEQTLFMEQVTKMN